MAKILLMRGRTRRRATTVVETAVVLPALLLVLFGALEYGWMFVKAQEVTSIARRAARLASLPDSTNSSVQNAVITLLDKHRINKGGQVKIAQSTSDGAEQPVNLVDLAPGAAFTVTVTVDYGAASTPGGQSLALNLFGLPVPDQLKGSVTMAREGVRPE